MAKQRSFIENLTYRRVPQIVGMYVAATWLVIELGDWVTDRFGFQPDATSFVFVAMLVMLPAIILFAYNHGAPGKDQWSKSERTMISLNALVAVGVLYFIGPSLVVEAATKTVQIPDETGVIQEFEVAREGYHREVLGFFWKNESASSELDWLSYGLPVMLAHDLNRVSPVLTVVTPFQSNGVQAEMRSRGYESLLDVPRGLTIEIARDRRSSALIVGRFGQDGDTRTVDITVIDAESGDELGSHSFSGADWLTAVDDVSEAVLRVLEIEPGDNQSDDPISQHLSDSIVAIKHYVNADIALTISNDYPTGIAEYESAVELDPAFAEASGSLSIAYYLSGDIESARVTASKALRNGYRLSDTSKFRLKANRYIYDGDYVRGERVLDVWTQVQPNSTAAFRALAGTSRFKGTAEGLIKASAAYDRLLELDPNDLDIYRDKASLELQRGHYQAAAGYLRNFLDQKPDDGAVHLQLADIYLAQGDLDAAQRALEDAAILSDDPLPSELGLARLAARLGEFDRAEERLAGQLSADLGPQQRIEVMGVQTEVALVRGRISRSLELIIEINDMARALMPPMVRLVSIESQQSSFLLLLGEMDDALAFADDVIARLQPPLNSYLNFTYTSIYAEMGDRERFREWAQKTIDVRDQLPAFFDPFFEMDAARLAIWDEDFDTASRHIDRAHSLFAQSFIQTLQNNLSTLSLQVKLAELYLDANEPEKCLQQIEGILRIFPAHAHAMLVAAKAQFALGEENVGLALLDKALKIWSAADENYIHRKQAVMLLDGRELPTKPSLADASVTK